MKLKWIRYAARQQLLIHLLCFGCQPDFKIQEEHWATIQKEIQLRKSLVKENASLRVHWSIPLMHTVFYPHGIQDHLEELKYSIEASLSSSNEGPEMSDPYQDNPSTSRTVSHHTSHSKVHNISRKRYLPSSALWDSQLTPKEFSRHSKAQQIWIRRRNESVTIDTFHRLIGTIWAPTHSQ